MRHGWPRGFTLIELMVVVVIVAVLAAVAVASYSRYQTSARKTEGVGAVNDIRMKQETFYSTYSRYVNTTSATNTVDSTKWAGVQQAAPYDTYFKYTESCPNPTNGWCNLAFQPPVHNVDTQTDLMWFQFQSVGWAPGRAVPTDGGGNAMIQNANNRWLVVRARGLQRGSSPVMCTEVRYTNESTDVLTFDLEGSADCP